MPVRYVPYKKGYSWGKSGKIYTGPKAKEKAQKQGTAILISQGKTNVKASSRARGYTKQI